MDMKADFHCHTTASDGSLTPIELIDLAIDQQITHLAITDHDTTAGYQQVIGYAEQKGICLISGSEISCQWQGHTIHIVGLDMDVSNRTLQNGLKLNRVKRWERAFAMNAKAQKKRIHGLLEDILPKIQTGMIGRNHFATELVERKLVKNHQRAFDKMLKRGRPLFQSVDWPELTEVVKWIVEAGGVAVIAHPHIYKMSANKLNKMIEEFKSAGGQAIEVVNQPRVCSEQIGMACRAKRYGLYTSLGSDFHSPDHVWRGLGWLSPMPEGVDPVWNHLKSIKNTLEKDSKPLT